MFDVFGRIIAGAMVLTFIAFIVLVVCLIAEYFGGIYVLLMPLTLITCWFIGLLISRYWS